MSRDDEEGVDTKGQGTTQHWKQDARLYTQPRGSSTHQSRAKGADAEGDEDGEEDGHLAPILKLLRYPPEPQRR